MKKIMELVVLLAFLAGCAGNAYYFNREGWSHSFTEEQFTNKLIKTEEEAIKEKVELERDANTPPKGKASVKVLVDRDGGVIAAAVDKKQTGIAPKILLNAAKKSKYNKLKDHINRPTEYVVYLKYIY